MHTGKRYRLRELLVWTKRETLFMTAVAVVPTVLSAGLGWRWLEVPWVPIAMLGTASAFTVGFRNNATYARTWEARQIWGGIVNASRAWGLLARDLVGAGEAARAGGGGVAAHPADGGAGAGANDGAGAAADGGALAVRARAAVTAAAPYAAPEEPARLLVHRHVAWLTALRYQLREPRGWENMDRPDNVAYRDRYYTVPEHDGALPAALGRLLPADEAEHVLAQANRATAILAVQSAHVRALADGGALDSYRHVALARQLAELLDLQGRCERIKNFPYPRQFATLNYWFIRLFVWLVPFGMVQEFRKVDQVAIWLTIPFSVVVTWLFLALEKVGESTENPFEGSANDVPITALSRTIEIDLRQMLGEREVPPPLAPVHQILM
jgi:putative membrane protein